MKEKYMKEIKYIAYYDTLDNKKENRNYVLAATNKMDYIISTLNKVGFKVRVISASATKNKRGYKGKLIKLDNGNYLKLFRTFRWGNKLNRIISIFSMRLFLFFYLIINIKKNENVFVYHSLGYISLINLVKKIKKFNLILEIEEIYADVIGCERARKKEYKLFNQASAFIFPTELLNEKLNKKNKPYVIVYGTYQTEESRKCRFNDGKIHCVYAGTFDPRKGGAFAAAAAEFLDERYHIHILGFGTEKDKCDLLKTINEISTKTNCGITFDGLLSGEDYIRFIQSCDIGLSTQTPDADYNDTSFPSKVLSYMANGLRVVSIRIKTLEISELNNFLYYYDKNTPEAIAEAIKNLNINDAYSSREVLEKLDKKFTENVNDLLEVI